MQLEFGATGWTGLTSSGLVVAVASPVLGELWFVKADFQIGLDVNDFFFSFSVAGSFGGGALRVLRRRLVGREVDDERPRLVLKLTGLGARLRPLTQLILPDALQEKLSTAGAALWLPVTVRYGLTIS